MNAVSPAFKPTDQVRGEFFSGRPDQSRRQPVMRCGVRLGCAAFAHFCRAQSRRHSGRRGGGSDAVWGGEWKAGRWAPCIGFHRLIMGGALSGGEGSREGVRPRRLGALG